MFEMLIDVVLLNLVDGDVVVVIFLIFLGEVEVVVIFGVFNLDEVCCIGVVMFGVVMVSLADVEVVFEMFVSCSCVMIGLVVGDLILCVCLVFKVVFGNVCVENILIEIVL